ncbi:transposase [Rheinheimera sp. WS51]|uniref:transposase n=1 Tax=Rheinheimera sp. WS51 TaxID=3425886 RepID=UPI003D94A522
MKKSNRYTSEFRERAIRLVTTQQHEYPSLWAALVSISDKLGCTPETLRAWVKKSQAQPSKPSSNTQSTEERLAALERENKELKRTNDILRQAAAFFDQAELDRKQK